MKGQHIPLFIAALLAAGCMGRQEHAWTVEALTTVTFSFRTYPLASLQSAL
ncbi:hypothetical protein [Methanofollis tationis]|uniref:Uncharacterized protein n=1 Tax=Methanofollis tationis TaxID=81417 RepID=A0A7K4HQG5_9EURY|nr:hypothetical protein [Methanofollis tationis]NVO67481.1 hypothetical protein [Methanofollis tationis]